MPDAGLKVSWKFKPEVGKAKLSAIDIVRWSVSVDDCVLIEVLSKLNPTRAGGVRSPADVMIYTPFVAEEFVEPDLTAMAFKVVELLTLTGVLYVGLLVVGVEPSRV